MLKVEGLRKNYKDFSLDVSLGVPTGAVTGLVGRRALSLLLRQHISPNFFCWMNLPRGLM